MAQLPNKKSLVLIAIIVFIILLIGLVLWDFSVSRPGDILTPTAPPLDDTLPAVSVAKELDIPWALDFLPDGSIIFTERAGRIRLIDEKEGLLPDPLLTIDEVAHRGEGGLLGIVLHPDFVQNSFVYVYYTYQNGAVLANRVVRFRKHDNNLSDKEIIIDNIPGASIHNGGRIKFGPDGHLYITTGDANNPDLAQDENSLAGKILRLKDDGTIPADNPFPDSPVYSFGHRNPQGLVWDGQGVLWATEHGPRANDELNLIEPGKNYGWPIVQGDEEAPGFVSPVIHSGTETWAPSGAAYLDGSLFFAGLRGQSLYEVVIDDQPVSLRRHLNRDFGRLRDVVVGPDNFLYILTSNRDGRGMPGEDDDRIIRIDPGKFR
ncbi:glucose/sorbosone dehydrogenase [Candidatus Methanoperedens nitroreducens]|uniref:Glucose/sorbosone dehydrogenase n=1 Tax=Candidatus Methanoperedens nitratireducens TaxID=1392998 RepID=A0A062V9A2_9EURY|nr:PQQ-dependent sugar dehydrogenase [Candidatus Methanoperedens nitroreducens]KCZ72334.1 glucose/sorbosone dehydrogenase [Candidatus Methanoperedens nitroreducens]MDJ1423732.1 PQQ-dependent sugar dehydrogenase [Candidatus Methanoperedens sp.]